MSSFQELAHTSDPTLETPLARFVRETTAEKLAIVRRWASDIDVNSKYEIDRWVSMTAQSDFSFLQELLQNQVVDDLRRSLTVYRDSVSETLQAVDVQQRVIIGSGVVFSAGMVAWLLRGGALAAALLSSLPVWSTFDPIPVLSQRRRHKSERQNSDPDDAGEAALAKVLRPGILVT